MKIQLLHYLFLLSIAILLSCNKEKAEELAGSYFFEVKIDGVDFKTELEPLVSFGAHLAQKGDFFNIQGKDMDGNGFTIWIEGPLREGTFETKNLNATRQTAIVYEVLSPYQSWTTAAEGASGTITISKNTAQYLKGTFSFTGVNEVDGSTKIGEQGRFQAKKL